MNLQKANHEQIHIGGYVVHAPKVGLLVAGEVVSRAQKKHKRLKTGMWGKTTIRGKTYYWHARTFGDLDGDNVSCPCQTAKRPSRFRRGKSTGADKHAASRKTKPMAHCLGTTQDGSPRHPSRLGYASILEPFKNSNQHAKF